MAISAEDMETGLCQLGDWQTQISVSQLTELGAPGRTATAQALRYPCNKVSPLPLCNAVKPEMRGRNPLALGACIYPVNILIDCNQCIYVGVCDLHGHWESAYPPTNRYFRY